jgi:hypothetical protein
VPSPAPRPTRRLPAFITTPALPALGGGIPIFGRQLAAPPKSLSAADLAVKEADKFERVPRPTGANGTSDPSDNPYGREVVPRRPR